MGLTSNSKWGVTGSVFALALIIFSRWMFYLMDMIFASKHWISSEKGAKPTMFGMFLHALILAFAMYGILCLDWACVD
jgi:hypothetical protein